MAPLGFLERHCSPLLSTGQLELPCLPLIPSHPTPPVPPLLQQPLLRFRWHRGAAQDENSRGCCWGREEMCHAVRAGSLQGCGGDRERTRPGQIANCRDGEQSSQTVSKEGDRDRGKMVGRGTSAGGHGHHDVTSHERPSAIAHAGWPQTLLAGKWVKLPLAMLPACSGATPRHLGTENGHFENTTHQVL